MAQTVMRLAALAAVAVGVGMECGWPIGVAAVAATWLVMPEVQAR
jgi:hypothetical protein